MEKHKEHGSKLAWMDSHEVTKGGEPVGKGCTTYTSITGQPQEMTEMTLEQLLRLHSSQGQTLPTFLRDS